MGRIANSILSTSIASTRVKWSMRHSATDRGSVDLFSDRCSRETIIGRNLWNGVGLGGSSTFFHRLCISDVTYKLFPLKCIIKSLVVGPLVGWTHGAGANFKLPCRHQKNKVRKKWLHTPNRTLDANIPVRRR